MAFDFPAAPANGTEFTPPGGPTYVYQAPVWLVKGSSTSGLTISDTPPANPVHEDQWWESDTGSMFVYYQDADSGQWVQTNVGGGSGGGGSPLTFGTGLTLIGSDVNLDAATTAIIGGLNEVPVDTLSYYRKDQSWVLADHIQSQVQSMWAGFEAGPIFSVKPNVGGTGTTHLFAVSPTTGISIIDHIQAAASDIVLSATPIAGAGSVTLRGNGRADATTEFKLNALGHGYFNGGVTAYDADRPGIAFRGIVTPMVVDYKGPAFNHGMVVSNRDTSAMASAVLFNYGTGQLAVGNITCGSSATTYGTTSDIRTKANVRAIDNSRALVDALEVIAYEPALPAGMTATPIEPVEGVTPPSPIPPHVSVSAQQAYTIYPQAVAPPDVNMPGYNPNAVLGDDDFRPWFIDHSKFVPLLIANLQEANARIDTLEARLAALEGTP